MVCAVNIAMLSTAVGLIATLGGGGFWAAQVLGAKAEKSELLAVNAKSDYVIDRQMESQLAQINRLEDKNKKTQDDREQLRYLREELQRLRDIRKQR